jgi:ketosteroid isomerase-like protein
VNSGWRKNVLASLGANALVMLDAVYGILAKRCAIDVPVLATDLTSDRRRARACLQDDTGWLYSNTGMKKKHFKGGVRVYRYVRARTTHFIRASEHCHVLWVVGLKKYAL